MYDTLVWEKFMERPGCHSSPISPISLRLRVTVVHRVSSRILLALASLCAIAGMAAPNPALSDDFDIKAQAVAIQSELVISETIQIQLDDGTPIGNPTVLPDVEKDGGQKPASLLFLDYDAIEGYNYTVRADSDTTDVDRVSAKSYVVDEPGSHTVEFLVIVQDKEKNIVDLWKSSVDIVVEGDVTPDPVDPDDNEPDVDPDEPAPIADGPRVMIVEETSRRTSLPSDQVMIFTSRSLRDYIDGIAAKRNGRTEFRVVDIDAEFTGSGNETFIAMLSDAREFSDDVPRLLISNGIDTVYNEPLPSSVEAVKAVLAKYAPKQVAIPAPGPKPAEAPSTAVNTQVIVPPVATPRRLLRSEPVFEQRLFQVCDPVTGTCRYEWRRVRVR
jgi:hypothetical protein